MTSLQLVRVDYMRKKWRRKKNSKKREQSLTGQLSIRGHPPAVGRRLACQALVLFLKFLILLLLFYYYYFIIVILLLLFYGSLEE
jgi:hypothetical protein